MIGLAGGRTRWGIALALVVALAAGCGTAAPASPSEGGALGRIRAQRALAVGTAGSMPPFNMTTRRGEVIGLDVDLARAMAQALGVQLRLVTMPFADLLPAVEAGRVDAVISGMTITPERSARVAFAGPYFVSGKSMLARADGPVPGKTPAELNDPGVRLTALRDSTSQAFVQQAMPRATLALVGSYDEGIALVLGDAADALVADFPVCVFSVFRYPDRGLWALVTPLNREPIGIGMPKNDRAFEQWTQRWLEGLEASGQLTRMQDRWFKDPSWLGELP